MITHYQTYTNHLPGSRQDESSASPLCLPHLPPQDPTTRPTGSPKPSAWSARVIERTDRWSDPIVSTSLGRQLHAKPASEDSLAATARATYTGDK